MKQRPTETPEEPQNNAQRVLAFLRGLVSDWRPLGTEWQPTTTQRWWVVRIAIVLGILVAVGYAYDKTLWDWMTLLIVPAVLAAGGYLFARAENRRTERIADQRAQDEALQAYLDRMGKLLLDKDEPSQQPGVGAGDRITQARAHTLTILRRLDPSRKRSVMDFLYEANLIKKNQRSISLGSPDRDYSAADLSKADLRGAVLRSADLSGLTGANLSGADLRDADLSESDLSGANLLEANLLGADLSGANLQNAKGATGKELAAAASLSGTIMPDGQEYTCWLGTTEGQDWLRKYKKDLGADKKRESVYEDWIKYAEGQMWLKAVGKEENGGTS